jgi:hypothetical protein
MESRAETLRRRSAFYRRLLQEGVETALAGEYLAQILTSEAELRAIAEEERKNEQAGCHHGSPQSGETPPSGGR